MRELKEYLNTHVRYEDGSLYWKIKHNPMCDLSKPLGRLRKDGYVDIKLMGKRFLAHRIVWMLHHGVMPDKTIDHINRNRSDNHIENLRDVSQSENCKNSGNHYHYCKRERKWLVYVNKKYLGRFNTEDEARIRVIQSRLS